MAHSRHLVALPPLLASALAAQQPVQWLHVPLLNGRGDLAMAHDDHRARTVLFGGRSATETFGDTWEYDGVHWLARTSRHAPRPRSRHQMAYDRARGRVVLFGGTGDGAWPDDTWEWDGVDWRQHRTQPAPFPRTGHMLAYDSVRQVTLLYGGDFADTLLWSWNGTAWSTVPQTNNPGLRARMGAAFDEHRGRLVLHGGMKQTPTGMGPSDETWEWDGAAWHPAQPVTVPPLLYAPTPAVYDAGRQRTVICAGSPAQSTWEWDGLDWSLAPGGQPPHFEDHAGFAYDRARGRCVLFVGRGRSGYEAKIVEYDGSVWTVPRAVTPSAGSLGPVVSDLVRKQIVVHGDGPRWAFDGGRWTELPASSAPPWYVWSTSFARDEARDRTVRFGGWNGTLSNETWVFDGTTWQQRFPAQSPPPSHGQLGYDPLRQRIVLCADLASMWEWDGATWHNVIPPSAPSARSDAPLAFDFVRGGVLLHGGLLQTAHRPIDESWSWNGATWTLASASGPRVLPSGMATDPLRQRIVAMDATHHQSRLWEWDGAVWNPLPNQLTPPFRGGDALAWDPAQQRIVLLRLDGVVWSYGAHTPSASTSFGTGCGGTSGVPLLVANQPRLGNDGFTFDVPGAAPSSLCAIGLSHGSQNQPLGGGCTLYLPSGFMAFVALTNAHGFASVGVPLPVAPALRGVSFTAQGIALDPTVPLGATLTAALRVTLGD